MKKMAYNYLKFFLAFILVINTVFVCSPFAFADESTKRELTVVEEDVMMRSDFEKHYIMSDGSRIALSYPEAVNYEYNGEWLEVDNTLSLKRGRYENNNKEFSVSFSDDLRDEDVVSLVFDGYTMSWTLDIQQNNRKSLSLSEDAEVVVLNPESIFENTQDSGSEFATSTDRGEAITLEKLLNYSNNNSEIIYDNAFGSNVEVDLSYKLSHNKVKEDIIFNKETEFSALVVTIDANGLEPTLMDDNSVIFTNMKGEIIFNLEAPYMYDAVGAYLFDINVKIERTDEGCVIIYIPDSKWLLDDSRVYPLILEPTVTSRNQQSNYVDTYVHSGDSPGDHNTELYLRVGLYNSQIHRSYLKINQMPSIPSNAIIFYSTLTLNLTSGTSTGGEFSIYRVMSSWNETGISYSNQPGSNLIVSGVPCDTRRDKVEFNVTTVVRNYFTGNFTNHGFMVRYTDETFNDYNVAYSSNYSDSEKYPVLMIQYNMNMEEEDNNTLGDANILSIANPSGNDSHTFGTLSSIVDVDWFEVTPARHGRVYVTVYFPSGYKYNVKVYNSNSTEVAYDYSSQTNFVSTYSFMTTKGNESSPSCPTYYIKINTTQSSTSSETYRVVVFYATNYRNLGWTYPVTGKTDISSPLGYRVNYSSYHKGIDIPGSTSNKILSACSGKVIRQGFDRKSMGNYIIIQSNVVDQITGRPYVIRYMHLSSVNSSVTVDSTVTQGQELGYMGSTGNSEGVHLHFDVNTASNQSQKKITDFINPIDIYDNTVKFYGNVY